VAALILAIVAVMMPLTWIRNNEWGTDLRLFETEYRRSGTSPDTLRYLTGGALRRGNSARAAEICDRHAVLIGLYTGFARHCGQAYAALARTEDAEKAFLAAVAAGGDPSAANNLAMLYLTQGRRLDAIVQFQQAIDLEDHPPSKHAQGISGSRTSSPRTESLAKAKEFSRKPTGWSRC
jgi:tetratricopeptide (TPR) repeat protein